jgi:hypothetical protein
VLEDAGMDGVSFHPHGQRDLKGIGAVDIYELVYDKSGPRKMRPQPRESLSRQWTVLPATVGLTEFFGGGRSDVVLAPSTPSVAPAKVGNYELVERLGGGGMGDVYKARHSQFGRQRAVKVIRSHFVEAGHREVIRRFYQEIKAVGALEHPNIVVAIDSSTPSDTVHYLVMEYLDGIGVDELVARNGPLDVADACEIVRQAARGLAYIHQHGMVHRDIKPSNLMLTVVPNDGLGSDTGAAAEPAGRRALVKILDLGLALLIGEDQQRLTVFDDRAMGTAMYMSPEQWRTTSVDIRADIYSLGCTLYHLLAGKPPFWDSDLRPEKAHERESLPAIHTSQPIPRELWQLLERMTAKQPEKRFAEPGEVVAALAPFAEGHQLVRLVERVMRPRASALTEGVERGDTLLARRAESDTLAGRTPAPWSLPTPFSPASRRKAWRMVSAVGILAAVLVIGWLALQATQRRESVADARQTRQQALVLAANYATNEILREINQRFDFLTKLAKDPELQQMMSQIDREPQSEALWRRVEEKLGAAKQDSVRVAPADSWFISRTDGIQVARSPRSDASRGQSYLFRDYFHGQGRDFDPEKPLPPDLKPVSEPHLSAVYRSTTSGMLKVAFSVPIDNGRSGAAKRILGVLAMSVDLGEFNVLEKLLPPGHEVVLIDLRESDIGGAPRRGLILHRQAPGEVPPDEEPRWVGPELLAEIDELLAANQSAVPATSILLPTYRDAAVTDDKPYWGAMKPVVDLRPDEELRNTRWLVLVQEPAPRK